ncbi:MAG: hypothetical protein HXX20_01675 [Chloroflexi bacterium]|nr:hypothetical protein [Chloroflexota bacterium]
MLEFKFGTGTGTNTRTGTNTNTGTNTGAGGLGGILKGFSSVMNLISDLAEKAEQAQSDTRSGESGDREKGFVVSWGFKSSSASEGSNQVTEFGSRPSPFMRPTSRPTPSSPDSFGKPGGRSTATPNRKPTRPPAAPLNNDLAPTLREPYIEIHSEAEEGQIVLVVELPDVTPENLQLEVYDDVLILRAQGSTCRYEKEVLLPEKVEPEPESCNFQNGVLEIRLRRLKTV